MRGKGDAIRCLRLLAVALMSVSLFACASKPKTDVDYDTSYDFLAIKTYAWLEQPPEAAQTTSLHAVRVKEAVDEELNRRGMQVVDAESADVLVAYHLVVDTKYNVDNYYNQWGYRGYHRSRTTGFGMSTTSRVREYKVGTILVDLIDPKQKQVIWRGSVSSRLKKNVTPEERDVLIRQSVADLMAPYPPL
ncbi:DUF4136 domain-containing protein [Corallincola platygyrae]|uniref:DUF4136 domain-containing protein n=1 Tax=Corallincola platygyrae TaxID=1193278 RepID=A0ABW4XKZ9_9GAMM